VPGDVQAHGFGLNVMPAPDGKRLYVLQDIVRNSQQDGYRFAALDLIQQAVTLTRLVERANNGELGCGTWGLRFTADGHYLYGYCGADHPIRPVGYVQYLDTQSGLFDPKVVLEGKVAQSQSPVYNISYALPSPDGKWLYIVSWRSREVFVFDVAQRNVVRSTVLNDIKPTSANPLNTLFAAMSNWFVGTASAKFYAQPAVLLSPDGLRLYVVDIKDFDKGDGLWAVETATLKPLGHWLAGKDTYGIQLSADGREVFAASPSDSSVQVLDALTGETRRALKSDQTVVKPIGFVAAQSY
jgi:WD40-like Beta Propeller Repeat